MSQCPTPNCAHVFPGLHQCPRCQTNYPKPSPTQVPHAALVLCFDGGGVRGLSSLYILNNLMRIITQLDGGQAGDLPSNYFDFIIGTSTGGLIATMLGRLELTAQRCIDNYRGLIPNIFGRPRIFHVHNRTWLRSKYNGDRLETEIENIVRHYAGNPPLPMPSWHNTVTRSLKRKILRRDRERQTLFPNGAPFGGPGCKTVAIAVGKAGLLEEEGYLFRSYDHTLQNRHGNLKPRNPGYASTTSIVDVARATSAAPSFFREVYILNPGGQSSRYMDGGVLHNNPSQLAWNEVCEWQIGVSEAMPRLTSADAIGCFVSIGCGRTRWQIFGNEGEPAIATYRRMGGAPRKMITDPRPVHRQILSISRYFDVPYYRFNVYDGLEEVELDECVSKMRSRYSLPLSTIDYIQMVTSDYLGEMNNKGTLDGEPQNSVQHDLRAVAQTIINYHNQRRATKANTAAQAAAAAAALANGAAAAPANAPAAAQAANEAVAEARTAAEAAAQTQAAAHAAAQAAAQTAAQAQTDALAAGLAAPNATQAADDTAAQIPAAALANNAANILTQAATATQAAPQDALNAATQIQAAILANTAVDAATTAIDAAQVAANTAPNIAASTNAAAKAAAQAAATAQVAAATPAATAAQTQAAALAKTAADSAVIAALAAAHAITQAETAAQAVGHADRAIQQARDAILATVAAVAQAPALAPTATAT